MPSRGSTSEAPRRWDSRGKKGPKWGGGHKGLEFRLRVTMGSLTNMNRQVYKINMSVSIFYMHIHVCTFCKLRWRTYSFVLLLCLWKLVQSVSVWFMASVIQARFRV